MTSLLFLVAVEICHADQNAPNTSEYTLKAVCLYNFTHFTYWPAVKEPKGGKTIVIGVVGRSPFGGAFEDLQAHLRETHNKNIAVVYYGPYSEEMNLQQSHLLFISDSEKNNMAAIVSNLHGAPVLTVSDMDGFLEAGGMISLIVRNNKVRWAINRTALNSAGLHLNAKMLQLALRVEEYPSHPESYHHFPVDDEWPFPAKVLVAAPAWRPYHRWGGTYQPVRKVGFFCRKPKGVESFHVFL